MTSHKWKVFEDRTHEYLKKRAETAPLVVHRFYDTRSAGDFLPSQPGDFLVIYRGVPILLELKSSDKHASLRACFSNNVSSGQLAQHRIWSRAEVATWFLFQGRDADFPYELWPGYHLVHTSTVPRARLDIRLKRSFWSLSDMLEAVLEVAGP